jgi:hypothetical protein
VNPTRILSILGSDAIAVTDGATLYQIKEDDTLSEVLFQKNIGLLYSKNSYVNETITLNKSTIKKDGSFLRIGVGDFVEIFDGAFKIIHPVVNQREAIESLMKIACDEKITYFGFSSVEYFSLYTDPNFSFNHSKLGFSAGVLAELKYKDKSLELTYDYRSMKVNDVKNNESTITLMMNFTLGKTYD